MKKVTLALIAIAVIIVAALSVAFYWRQFGDANGQTSNLPADKFVLIEHQVQTLASIEGDVNNASIYTYLGYPTFSYDQSIIAAKGVSFPPFNESLKAIYQYGTIVGIGGCHGADYNVSGIYGFPYRSDSSDGLEILGVDDNGYVYLSYQGQPIILEPRGIWSHNQSVIENVLPLNESEPIEVNLTISDRITNYGLCDK